MKKMIKLSVLLTAALMAVTACSDDEDTAAGHPTHFVSLEMNGSDVETCALGSTFADPGVKAEEDGVDVSAKVEATIHDINGRTVSTISTTEPTMYTITYSAANKDGFSSSTERKVFVYDPAVTIDISGTYTVDMDKSKRVGPDDITVTFAAKAGEKGYEDITKVTFTQVAPGIYTVSDFLAGWYSDIYAYGDDYLLNGYVSLNANNMLSVMYSHINGWDDGLEALDNAAYIPATTSISYDAAYAGDYVWTIYLSK